MRDKSILYALSAILMWSTAATAFKIALWDLAPTQLLFVASWTSFGVLWAAAVLKGKGWRLFRASPREHGYAALCGALDPFLYYILLFGAYNRLPAQQAQPLNYAWPLFLSAFSIFFLREKASLRSLFGLVVSFLGVALVASQNGEGHYPADLAGIILALASAMVWALYWLLNLYGKEDPSLRLARNFLYGSLYISVLLVVNGDWWRIEACGGVWAAVYVGLFEMGVAFLFWMKALDTSRKRVLTSSLAYLSPFLSFLLIHFILREAIQPASIIGLLLIVAGVALQAHRKSADVN